MIKIGKMKLNLLITVAMYMLIYNPPVLAISPSLKMNCIWVLIIPSAVYLYLNRAWLKENIRWKPVLWTEGILAVILAYLMLMAVINGNSVTSFSYLVYWMAGDIPFALAVLTYFRKRGEGLSEVLDHLLAAGALLAFTAILSMFVQPVKAFFTQLMIRYGVAYAELLADYRNYGLAANLTSTGSYVQAVLASIALYRGVRGKKAWYILFPILAFSANINTRASTILVLAGMAAVMVALLWTRQWKKAAIYALIVAASVAVAHFGMELVAQMNKRTGAWLSTGVGQMGDFISGVKTDDGYFGELGRMTSHSVFPQGLNLIFGAGTGVLGGSKYEVSSDVGYINDLWRGGILYSVVITGLYMWALVKVLRSRQHRLQDGIFLSGLYFLTWGATNIKGSFFIHSDLTVVFWILFAALAWSGEKNKDECGEAVK